MVAELLAAIKGCENETELTQVCDLIKEMKKPLEAVTNAVADSIAQGFIIGKKVKMVGDDEVGEIMKYNLSTVGFYTGDRYPIIVKFKRGTFEYSVESLTLVE